MHDKPPRVLQTQMSGHLRAERFCQSIPISLHMVLSGLATAWICPLSTISLSAENGVNPCWERQLLTSAHTFSPMVAKDSFRLKELENMG